MKKWILAAVVALLVSACAHSYSSLHDLVVVEPASDCLDTSRHHEIPLVITNRTGGRVAFYASESSGPPYVLHPYAFAVEPAEPKSSDGWGVILETYLPPRNEVRFDPDDRVEVLTYASLWPPPGYPGTVRAKVIDVRGHQHVSRAMAVCAPSATASASGRKQTLGRVGRRLGC